MLIFIVYINVNKYNKLKKKRLGVFCLRNMLSGLGVHVIHLMLEMYLTLEIAKLFRTSLHSW